MTGFVLRVITVAIGLWAASKIVSGLSVDAGWTLVGAAVLLGIVNATVRPVLVILTLPVSILTLGLFLLVINAGMLGLVALVFDGFHIAGFWSAIGGAIVVSIVSWIVSSLIGPKGRIEVITDRARS